MSRYLARLKALIAKDTHTRLTDATDKSPCVSFVSDQGSPLRDDESAIEERAAMAADRVPACYLDAWAWLNHQKPASVSEAEWWLALMTPAYLSTAGAPTRRRWHGAQTSCSTCRARGGPAAFSGDCAAGAFKHWARRALG
jgi:hypothetical protein